MSFRQVIERYGPAVGILAFLAIVVSGWLLANAFMGREADSKPVPQKYYYDQNTGELFTIPATTVGLVERDSGPYQGLPAGVEAFVYACGPCNSKGAKKIVAYLEMPASALPPEKRPQRPASAASETSEALLLVMRRPEDREWVYPDSPQAAKIFAQMQKMCPPGKRLNRCQPPSK